MGVGDREKPQECRRVTYLTPHSCSEIRGIVKLLIRKVKEGAVTKRG